MIRTSTLVPVALVLSAVLAAGGCGGTTESPSASPTHAALGSDDVRGSGEPSASPAPTQGLGSPSPAGSSPPPSPASSQLSTPTPAPTGTMLVRAYFLLEEKGRNPTLVPVLRTVPKSKATARAALTALLAGPTSREAAADPAIRTMIPDGTRLLDVSATAGVATVNLSTEFATVTSTFSARARLAQVVYTLTQFSSIDRVRFELDGQPVTTFPPSIAMNKSVSRATYRGTMLPDIWVDRPAWGAGLLPGGRVNGIANVFEAQFRLAVLDARGNVLVDKRVHATCGSGCWGSFDLTVSYSVGKGQWGRLRVWDPSERDGSPTSVREYPVWLSPS
jgi:germination protein M